MWTRREVVKTAVLAAAASSAARYTFAEDAAAGFQVPALPYSFGALEPYIDAQTMEIHHDKHHAGYVKKLNAALEGHADLAKKSVEELVRELDKLPEDLRGAVRNHGGGHYNHSLFWQMMSPKGGAPKGDLLKAIEKGWGSVDGFWEKFAAAGGGVFGSGWAWLTLDAGALKIEGSSNQDNPLSQGRMPLLGIDVWEHAYYLKYQNKRADYLTAWRNVVNWDFVASRYAAAVKA